MASTRARNPIVLRQGENIGAPAAEDDDQFLFDAFYENYAYAALASTNDPRFLLVGRTGTGKTAILRKIERDEDNVIRIDPQELSLQYISNSDIISYLQSHGVKLDLFYQLLWRHVIAVELIKRKFKLESQASTERFFSRLQTMVNEKRRRAIEYMKSFGDGFWLETDARVTQVTQKFEQDLHAALGANESLIGGKMVATEEQKKDIIHRAQRVIDSLHIQQLSDVIEWLADSVFDDDQQRYYVIIDDLDLNFAFGDIKLWLVRALIETCKKYKRIENVKIIVALRADLIERVFEQTRDDGFQEEKYRGNILNLYWNKNELKDLVNRRLSLLAKRQYSGSNISFSALFTDQVSGNDSFSYLIDRTLYRPRDIIAFVNECIEQAIGKDKVSLRSIRVAEQKYSPDRFNALRDEWRALHPLLLDYCRPLLKRPRKFPLFGITDQDWEDLVLNLAVSPHAGTDVVGRKALHLAQLGDKFSHQIAHCWLDALYKIGVIGIRTASGVPIKWAYNDRQFLNEGDYHNDSTIYIHPMLWIRFGVASRDAELSHEDD